MLIFDEEMCAAFDADTSDRTLYGLDLVEVDNGEVVRIESQLFSERADLIQHARHTELDWNEQWVCKVQDDWGKWYYDAELTAIVNVIEFLDDNEHYKFGYTKGAR